MVQFQTVIKKFAENGEKTGWTYIIIPFEIAEKLKPGFRKSFRVKGFLDKAEIKQISLLPMGEGDFIMALNATIRKTIKKGKGDKLNVKIEVDQTEKKLSTDFLICLKEEPPALKFFKTLPKGHQNYFSNWIESAKTEATKAKRIAQAITALSQSLGFAEMVRMNNGNK